MGANVSYNTLNSIYCSDHILDMPLSPKNLTETCISYFVLLLPRQHVLFDVCGFFLVNITKPRERERVKAAISSATGFTLGLSFLHHSIASAKPPSSPGKEMMSNDSTEYHQGSS